MSELDDRLIEGRAVVATMGPPEDLWSRVVERSHDSDAPVHDVTIAQHRRRPSLWLAVAAVAALLVLIGALTLLDDDQTVDTVPVTELPAVTEDQTIADHAVLTPDDMPDGWVAAPPEDEEERQAEEEDELDQALADCLGIDASELQNDRPTARSAFVNSEQENDEHVVSEVTVFASEREAQQVIDRFRDDAAQQCYVDVIEQQIAEAARDGLTTISGRALSGDDLEIGESTISELYLQYVESMFYYDLGDDSVGFSVMVPLSSEGVEVDVYADFELVREGRATVQTTVQTYFTRFTEAVNTKMVVDRIPPDA